METTHENNSSSSSCIVPHYRGATVADKILYCLVRALPSAEDQYKDDIIKNCGENASTVYQTLLLLKRQGVLESGAGAGRFRIVNLTAYKNRHKGNPAIFKMLEKEQIPIPHELFQRARLEQSGNDTTIHNPEKANRRRCSDVQVRLKDIVANFLGDLHNKIEVFERQLTDHHE